MPIKWPSKRIEESEALNVPLTESEQQLFDDRDKHLKSAHVVMSCCVALFEEASWTANDRRYQLKPETVESLLVFHALTGNEQYRVWARDIFKSTHILRISSGQIL